MALNGDVKTFSLIAVGRMILTEKKTGRLRVESHGRRVVLYFAEGRITALRASMPADPSLPALLRCTHAVSETALNAAMAEAKTQNRALAGVLLQNKQVTPQTLAGIYNQQFKEIMAGVLLWPDCGYTYTDGSVTGPAVPGLKIDPVRLLTDAAKWVQFRRIIPSDRTVFQIQDRLRLSDFPEREAASRILLLIDGRRDVSQIIAQAGFARSTVYRLMAALAAEGVITPKDTSAPPTPSETSAEWQEGAFWSFYRGLLQELILPLVSALGMAKTQVLLSDALHKSLFNTPGAQPQSMPSQTDGASALDIFIAAIHRHCLEQPPHQRDVIVQWVVCTLFQEVYQVLGLRLCHSVLEQVLKWATRSAAPNEDITAGWTALLQRIRADEDILRGQKNPFRPVPEPRLFSTKTGLQYAPGSAPNEMAAVIALFRRGLGVIMQDLRTELGGRAAVLLQDAIQNSDFSIAFDAADALPEDEAAVGSRIQHYLADHGAFIHPETAAAGFQHILCSLVDQEKVLLGANFARSTAASLKNVLSADGAALSRPAATLLAAIEKAAGAP